MTDTNDLRAPPPKRFRGRKGWGAAARTPDVCPRSRVAQSLAPPRFAGEVVGERPRRRMFVLAVDRDTTGSRAQIVVWLFYLVVFVGMRVMLLVGLCLCVLFRRDRSHSKQVDIRMFYQIGHD